ncbi:egl-9 [Symbiodinium natans]|uniref:Egl-9 protein n=1 Tax=Symbiodinium natans TaxID=878477 RepID=A0A812SH52_9DINO|nr:egl-9 [Symbiodinium natans]
MLHRPPNSDDLLEEVWAVLEAEVHAGRTRCLGASNITAAQLEALTRPSRKQELWPALVQLKCSPFHQGGYFVDSPSGLTSLWHQLRTKRVVPVGISLFNPLHSCVSPLEEPLISAWAEDLGCSSAELLAHWCRSAGVCPLLRCAPHHAVTFRREVHLRPPLVAALSSLACLTETSFCPALRDDLALRKSCKRTAQRGDSLYGRLAEVHSLKSQEGQLLNGQRGRILSFEEETGRWQVDLLAGSRKIRGANLALIDEGAAAATAESAGAFLKELLSTGGSDAMLQLLAGRRSDVTWALLETVSANLENAQACGHQRKQQVLQRLLAEVKKVLASQQPTPQTVPLPMPPLDASAAWQGPAAASRRLLHAVSCLLEAQGYAICDNFASPEDVRLLAAELAAYDQDFETAKIWVGKQASGAQLSVPTVRSDRIFWVCGEHRTPAREMLWDSAGKQPTAGLAPCRPEVVMEKTTHGFPRLRATMNRVDDFVLHGLAKHVSRLSGLAERSDAMVSIYDGGARFQKHVDNPNKDGRVLTSIVYLNSGEPWGADDGGQLRMFPEGEPPLEFAPETGRLVLFWADRLPHEVLPAKRRRMALTYWWFDRTEREAKVQELADEVGNQRLKVSEESLAQDFIAFMLSDKSSPAEIVQKAHTLPAKALSTVATVVGAADGQEALEGIGRLTESDLSRLRGSMGKMGLQ